MDIFQLLSYFAVELSQRTLINIFALASTLIWGSVVNIISRCKILCRNARALPSAIKKLQKFTPTLFKTLRLALLFIYIEIYRDLVSDEGMTPWSADVCSVISGKRVNWESSAREVGKRSYVLSSHRAISHRFSLFRVTKFNIFDTHK